MRDRAGGEVEQMRGAAAVGRAAAGQGNAAARRAVQGRRKAMLQPLR